MSQETCSTQVVLSSAGVRRANGSSRVTTGGVALASEVIPWVSLCIGTLLIMNFISPRQPALGATAVPCGLPMNPAAAPSPFAQHGGHMDIARSVCPDAPKPWIDLSTAINPNPYPAPRASMQARARLPDPQELQKLEVAAARAFGVDDPDRMLATAGSETVVRFLPHVLPSVTQATVVWPTYSSHTDSWQRARNTSRPYLQHRASIARNRCRSHARQSQ